MVNAPRQDEDGTWLAVQLSTREEAAVVRATGEIDMGSVGLLHAELKAAFTTASPLVVDLTETHFIGAAGLSELVAACERADRQRTPIALVANSGAVLRPIELAQLSPAAGVFDDVSTALRRVSGG